MKTLCLLFSILFSINLQAQDTIKVKTFNFQSKFRTDTFYFPDDPSESYRKILMVYKMRCHDITNGIGSECGKEGLKCNTYLIDPFNIDSSLSSHPEYLISNFKGTSFNYTTTPTYSAKIYSEHYTQLVGNVNQSIKIGNGTDKVVLYNGNGVYKVQYLFRKDELIAAGLTKGSIGRIKLDISSLGPNLENFRIRIRGFHEAELSSPNFSLGGYSEVYFNSASFETTGLKEFNFKKPYNWNETDMLIELSYSAKNGGPPINLLGANSAVNTVLASTGKDYALDLEGASTITVDSTALKTLSDEISISFWIYANNYSQNQTRKILEGFDKNNKLILNLDLPLIRNFLIWDCGLNNMGYPDRLIKEDNFINNYINNWNNYVLTKNAITGDMKVYQNGNLLFSSSNNFGKIDLKKLIIGDGGMMRDSFSTRISQIQIWDKELDENTIKEWMRLEVTSKHPYYKNLLVNYEMREGYGNILNSNSINNYKGFIDYPLWEQVEGKDLYKNLHLSSLRPNIIFEKGDFILKDSIVKIIDTSFLNPHQIIHFGILNNKLNPIDTQYVYQAGIQFLYNENGTIADTFNFPKQGTINVGSFLYKKNDPVKFELLSLSTPFSSADLGKNGKEFTFDVTDYTPILKGKKILSIENGGEYQEELDFEFKFIKGIPPRNVLNIRNIWKPDRATFSEILQDKKFESKKIKLDQFGKYFQIKSTISGYWPNEAYKSTQHFINFNSGTQENVFDVWKDCGFNPIYPQADNYYLDRAGWCPGMATDVHEFDITPYSKAGEIIDIDYGINSPEILNVNFLISNQIVTYGSYNFFRDAAIESILRPNNRGVENERINSACDFPIVKIKNTGYEQIQMLQIAYNIKNGQTLTKLWEGKLEPSQSTEIVLDVPSIGFWVSSDTQKVFEVRIQSVNDNKDDYEINDYLSSSYDLPPIYDFPEPIEIYFISEFKASENSFEIIDSKGNIIVSKNYTQKSNKDEILLSPGCYTFKFYDKGGNGISLWGLDDPIDGLELKRKFDTKVSTLKRFSEFMGGGLQYDFIIGKLTSIDPVYNYQLFSLYPNPASNEFNLELHGYLNEKMEISIVDLTGRILKTKKFEVDSDKFIEKLDINKFSNGMYFVKITNGKKSWTRSFIKQ